MQGDSFLFAFPFARQAVAGAVAGQQALREHDWESEPIRVRMGVHTGEPMQADGLYAGLDVHRAARVMSAARGSQVLLSARTADLVDGELPAGAALRDLGEYGLKDFRASRLFVSTSRALVGAAGWRAAVASEASAATAPCCRCGRSGGSHRARSALCRNGSG
jgi:class 3 adenylate cyclase